MRRRQFLKTSAAAPFATIPFTAVPTTGAVERVDDPRVKEIRSRIKPITNDERLERQERARRMMRDEKIDALLFEGGVSLNYFTGVSWGRSERLFAMILPGKGELCYVAPKFEEGRAREQVGNARLLVWEENESPYDLVKQALSDMGIATGTIGIEETTRFFVVDNIAKLAPGLRIASGTPVTAGCRSVKAPHEIELMQIANDITAEVYVKALPVLKKGMTEQELGRAISKLFSEFGVGGGALVLFGEASAYPHGLMKEHVLHEGDCVLIDGGCSVEGYASDVTRTTVFGVPSEKMRRVWEIIRSAQDAGLTAARRGVSAESVDAAARKVVVDSGFGPGYNYFTHRLGHGIGMEGHEWYYLVRGNTRPLQPGNIFSNEPGIYIPGEFGVRLEDEMLITEDGARLLLPQAESLEKIFGGK